MEGFQGLRQESDMLSHHSFVMSSQGIDVWIEVILLPQCLDICTSRTSIVPRVLVPKLLRKQAIVFY